mgnify:CR=1 FL=1
MERERQVARIFSNSFGRDYVWKLIHDAVDRNREGTAMHTVRHVIKRLEKLAVDHAYQIIQRGVCIRDTAEKGNFSFSHTGKIQFISIGQLGDLRQIEGCQPDTYTDQDGLGGSFLPPACKCDTA